MSSCGVAASTLVPNEELVVGAAAAAAPGDCGGLQNICAACDACMLFPNLLQKGLLCCFEDRAAAVDLGLGGEAQAADDKVSAATSVRPERIHNGFEFMVRIQALQVQG